jgi:anti-anti-sigma regulatory factor
MENSQTFVLKSRQQLIRFIAMMVAGAGALVSVVVLILIVVLPDRTTLATYLVLLGIGVLGGLATLYLIPRVVLDFAILPLVFALFAAAIGGALIFRETTLIAAAFLTIVALIVSMGQRKVALPLGIVTVLIGVGLAATTPQTIASADRFSLGPALPFVAMAGVGTAILVCWFIALHLITVSDQAVAIADERAREAESARADAEARATELVEQNEAQERLIALVATLEMPAVTLADGVILMPLIGHIDSRRFLNLTSRLLEVVFTAKVKLVIIDVSGVTLFDTAVVQGLMQTVDAVKLLGARVHLCGIQASVAMTLVQLGVDMDGVAIVRTPQDALGYTQATPFQALS